jgi:hypothetical protein
MSAKNATAERLRPPAAIIEHAAVSTSNDMILGLVSVT